MLTEEFTTSGTRRSRGDGSIYQGGDGTWHTSLSLGCDSDGRRVRRHVQAPSRRQVTTKLALLRLGEGPSRTVDEWTHMWLALVERTLKPSTARSYGTYIRYLGPLHSSFLPGRSRPARDHHAQSGIGGSTSALGRR